MKKYTAFALLVLFNFQAGTAAAEVSYQLPNDKSVTFSSGTVLNLNSFQGNYNLAGNQVVIALKGNKLFLKLQQYPYSSAIAGNYNKIYQRLVDTKEDYHFSVTALNAMFFPYLSEYELVPIGEYTFVLKKSGGLTVEFLHVGEKYTKDLAFRNQNGEIIDKKSFAKLLVLDEDLKKLVIENSEKTESEK